LSETVRLPAYLDWSGNAVYDLEAPGRIVDLCRAVLIEAASPQDVYACLDAVVLRRRRALLWLPAQRGTSRRAMIHASAPRLSTSIGIALIRCGGRYRRFGAMAPRPKLTSPGWYPVVSGPP
jgi:hypothetical protein